MTTRYVFRAIVSERFFYYWNREKADWYGGIDMASIYYTKPAITPSSNADKVEFITEAEAKKQIKRPAHG